MKSKFRNKSGLSFVFFLSALTLLIAISLGCSGKGDPLSPPGVREKQQTGPTSGGHVLWGMWDVAIDPATETIEAIPLRGAAFNANVTKFLQPPSAPVNYLTFSFNSGNNFVTGHIDINVTLRHPFMGLNKWRGFDVRGIVMGDGSVPFLFDSSALRAGDTDLKMENADGWTRWWNPTEFTTFGTILGYTKGSKAPGNYTASATINPYKYFADGLDADEPLADLNLDERGTFSTNPGINTRRYVIQFPALGGVVYHYNYAIDASWALPDESFAPEYPPEAYPPQANMQEAWRVAIDSSATDAWYVNDQAKGGSVKLKIEVFDWQGAYEMSGVCDEVVALLVDSPVLPGPLDVMPMGSVSSGGSVSSVWDVEIDDLNLTQAGTFDCWLAVESETPENYAPQIQGDPSNFDWPDVPLRAYMLGSIDVAGTFPTDAPVVTSVIPSQGTQSIIVTDLQILGENFQPGGVVEFDYDAVTSLTIQNIQWIDSGLITCDVNCAGPLGFYDVTVTNPDTQSGSLDDCFEVIEQQGYSIWWQSHMYNNMNFGYNPTVTGVDPNTLEIEWSSPVAGDKKYSTPVVADGKIFFTGNDGFYSTTNMTLYCFDLYSGGLLWSKPINPSGVYNRAFACPVWWAGPDGIDRLACPGDQVYCYNADTGEELWKFDADVGGVSASFISTQLQEYDGMVLARTRQAALFVLNFIDGSMISQVTCSSSSEGGCGAKDGKVYISSAHFLDCAYILTGEILWSTNLPNDADITHWINPTLIGSRCYFSTYPGYVFCVATEPDGSYLPGDVIWSWNDLDIAPGGNPLVGGTSVVNINGNNRIFVASAFGGNHVYCLEEQGDSVNLLWESAQLGYFDASPVWSAAPGYPDGVIYCPDETGNIVAFNGTDGSTAWNYAAGTELRSGVALVFDMVVVTSGTDVTVFKGP